MVDRWHEHILNSQGKGNNTLMNEKVLQGIKNAVRTYMSLYQNPNETRILAFAEDLYETGYSPEQIRDALEDIKNTEDKLASVAQIRQVLGLKFGRSREKVDIEAQRIGKVIQKQMERYKNQRGHFIKQTNEGYYLKFVKYYMEEVFPGVQTSDMGIETWGRIALADFYDAECDMERTIEIGRKRVDIEYEKRCQKEACN